MHQSDTIAPPATTAPQAGIDPRGVRWKPAAVIAGIAALHLATLALHIRFYGSLYQFTAKPLGDALSLCLIGLGAAGLLGLVRSRLAGLPYLAGVMALSVLLQFGLALTEGRGLEALRDHTVTSGHAEFARLAVALPDVGQMISGYEEMVRGGALGHFAPSKPPGTLLLYMLTERLAAPFAGPDRLARLQWAITWTWPLLATLAVLPLYRLGRLLFAEAEARLAAALYVAAPSVNLVQLHTDQAFFPTLFGLCLLVLVRIGLAQARGQRIDGPAVLAGGLIYAAAFFQLPLVFATVLAFGLVAAENLVNAPWPAIRTRLLEYTGLVAAGFAAAGVIGWVSLGYNPIVRYIVAMHYHAGFKQGAKAPIPAGLGNLAEFAAWSGAPLVGLAVAAVWLAGRRRGPDSVRHARVLGLAVPLGLTILYFAFLTGTQSEVARLWLFLLPVLAVLAGRGATQLGWTARSWPVALLVLLELATAYATKLRMDFF